MYLCFVLQDTVTHKRTKQNKADTQKIINRRVVQSSAKALASQLDQRLIVIQQKNISPLLYSGLKKSWCVFILRI